jgi:hypothetical protein
VSFRSSRMPDWVVLFLTWGGAFCHGNLLSRSYHDDRSRRVFLATITLAALGIATLFARRSVLLRSFRGALFRCTFRAALGLAASFARHSVSLPPSRDTGLAALFA